LAHLVEDSAHTLAAPGRSQIYLANPVTDPALSSELIGLARAPKDQEQQGGMALVIADRSIFNVPIRISPPLSRGYVVVLRPDGSCLFAATQCVGAADRSLVRERIVPIPGYKLQVRYSYATDPIEAAWRTEWLGHGILLVLGMSGIAAAMALR